MSRFILISLEEFVSLLNKADTECTLSEGLTFYGGRLSDYDDWLIKKKCVLIKYSDYQVLLRNADNDSPNR